MKDKLEAILFAAGKYVDEDHLAKLLGEDIRRVRKGLHELREDYEKRPECSLQVVQENKSWKLHVKDNYLDIVSKLVSDKEIATTVLETLAVVAWKNPIQQAELIKIRGPAAYEHITELTERGFVTKVPEGRTFKITLQEKFFEYFDVQGREGLSGLFKPVEEEAAAQQAEIDARKEVYEKQVDAVRHAVEKGVNPENMPVPELPSDLKPSAQNESNKPEELIAEVKAAVDKNTPKPSSAQEIMKETEDAIRDFGKDIAKLKAESGGKKKVHKSSAAGRAPVKLDQPAPSQPDSEKHE